MTTSKNFELWGDTEFEDIGDISRHYTQMSNDLVSMLNEWTIGQTALCEKLKDIRTISDGIAQIKSKLKAAEDKLTKAHKAGKPYVGIEAERDAIAKQLREQTAIFESSKRGMLLEGMSAQFNGILKFSQKAQQYGIHGSYLTSQIPQFNLSPGEALPKYHGRDTTHQIQHDFQKSLFSLPGTSPSSSSYRDLPVPVAASSIKRPKSPIKKKLEEDSDVWGSSNKVAKKPQPPTRVTQPPSRITNDELLVQHRVAPPVVNQPTDLSISPLTVSNNIPHQSVFMQPNQVPVEDIHSLALPTPKMNPNSISQPATSKDTLVGQGGFSTIEMENPW
ncbi:hypothetical protein HDV02_001512 [Globomyces sp. JEL0801]|nr:hypothetical protein HDV02_001512 [Globomyces sp. JEL0801]